MQNLCCIWPKATDSNQLTVTPKESPEMLIRQKSTLNLSRSHTPAFAATHSCTVSNIIVQHRESSALRTLTSLSCPLSVSFCNLHIAFLPCITSHVFYNPLTFHSSMPTAESKAGAVSQLLTQYNQPQLWSSFRRDK